MINRWLSRSSRTRPITRETVDLLDQLDFYRYADPRHIPELKENAIQSGDLFGKPVYRRFPKQSLIPNHSNDWKPGTGRAYFVDAEWLAEDGVIEFLELIRPFLSIQGARVSSWRREVTEEGYVLWIDEDKCILYSSDEFENKDANFWSIFTGRTFSVVNNLLEKAGSDERIFALYGGNDLEAVFLTRDLYRAIVRCPLPQEHLPYEALEALAESP